MNEQAGHEHHAVRPDETTECQTCSLLGGATWGVSTLLVTPDEKARIEHGVWLEQRLKTLAADREGLR